MKNWLHFLVLFAFVRLQFVCCCGSVDHVHLESQPYAVQAACCLAQVEHKCKCGHQHAQPNSTYQIELKSACGCQFCNQDDSHLPHLASEHLQILSSQKVRFVAMDVQQSLPIVVVADSVARYSWSSHVCEKCMQNDISILCRFGHLRI